MTDFGSESICIGYIWTDSESDLIMFRVDISTICKLRYSDAAIVWDQKKCNARISKIIDLLNINMGS